jgi:hypothetical protein
MFLDVRTAAIIRAMKNCANAVELINKGKYLRKLYVNELIKSNLYNYKCERKKWNKEYCVVKNSATRYSYCGHQSLVLGDTVFCIENSD